MNAGKMDRRITIERFSKVKDEFNEDVETWVNLTTVWANRKDVSDGERLSASQVNSSLMSRFTIRSSVKSKTITPNDRISYDGGVWDIHGAKETGHGRKRFIEITAMRQSD